MSSKRVLALYILPIAAAAAGTAWGSPVGDQFADGLPNFAVDVDGELPIGQSFTPRFSSVNFARLNLADASLDSEGGTFHVRIHEGDGLNGSVLGTSRSIYLPDGWGLDNPQFGGWHVWFAFNQYLAPIAEAPYTLELVKSSGGSFNLYGIEPSSYARGTAYESGQPRAGDFLFMVGTGFDTTPHGDFDNDLDADGADFLAWQRGVGMAGTAWRRDGDSYGDLDVDSTDLAVWREDFGPSHHFAVAVPEPGPWSGIMMAVTAALATRRSIYRCVVVPSR